MPFPLIAMFHDLPDPRATTATSRHGLVENLTIAVSAIIGGANGWEQIAEYGRRKDPFFRRDLALEHGIPRHDTFYQVFTRFRPATFAERIAAWMAAACEGTGLFPIAIDGKSARWAKRGKRGDQVPARGSRLGDGQPADPRAGRGAGRDE
jgi:hypothetical protein